jgi:hypothetical protein
VVVSTPNSGVFVFPTMISPLALRRRTSSQSRGDTWPCTKRDPSLNGAPSMSGTRSFRRKGTPANRGAGAPAGPYAREAQRSASLRAWSYSLQMTVLSRGLVFSIRRIVASSSSTGEIVRARMSSARPRAS